MDIWQGGQDLNVPRHAGVFASNAADNALFLPARGRTFLDFEALERDDDAPLGLKSGRRYSILQVGASDYWGMVYDAIPPTPLRAGILLAQLHELRGRLKSIAAQKTEQEAE